MKKLFLLILLLKNLSIIQISVGNAFSYAPEALVHSSKPSVLASFKLLCPLPEVPEKMMIYKAVDPRISQKDITQLMKAFGLEGKIVDRRRQFVVRDGHKVLEVFKQSGTGYLRFSNDQKLAAEKRAKKLPSEHKAIVKAKEFLRTHGLLSKNTFFVGTGYHEFREYNSEGELFARGRSAIAVGFGFKIEEMRVEGPGAKASVIFGEGGEIIGASKIWREIQPDKQKKILTPEEAFTRFKQRWPTELEPQQLEQAEIKTEVNIREVYLTYYAKPGCLPQDYLEPIYVFKGDYRISGRIGEREISDSDYFKIIIPAVTNRIGDS
ncbi:MAG: hypothetical protein GWN55_04840 [Phycisphaerae bacterium]|nr:hypothetical protein [Phycisphaerae bacterium]NIP55330.1 hypothetical protein [Phycisphaerae bacterium]NIS53843.1 hypothetical protein [Phycisphaerae bacterium]NIV00642.1 hypothetical protein [Phycisphaerae bacterium]NIV68930.1 hypothetical protein [Phycisphaerae bacterium]